MRLESLTPATVIMPRFYRLDTERLSKYIGRFRGDNPDIDYHDEVGEGAIVVEGYTGHKKLEIEKELQYLPATDEIVRNRREDYEMLFHILEGKYLLVGGMDIAIQSGFTKGIVPVRIILTTYDIDEVNRNGSSLMYNPNNIADLRERFLDGYLGFYRLDGTSKLPLYDYRIFEPKDVKTLEDVINEIKIKSPVLNS